MILSGIRAAPRLNKFNIQSQTIISSANQLCDFDIYKYPSNDLVHSSDITRAVCRGHEIGIDQWQLKNIHSIFLQALDLVFIELPCLSNQILMGGTLDFKRLFF